MGRDAPRARAPHARQRKKITARISLSPPIFVIATPHRDAGEAIPLLRCKGIEVRMAPLFCIHQPCPSRRGFHILYPPAPSLSRGVVAPAHSVSNGITTAFASLRPGEYGKEGIRSRICIHHWRRAPGGGPAANRQSTPPLCHPLSSAASATEDRPPLCHPREGGDPERPRKLILGIILDSRLHGNDNKCFFIYSLPPAPFSRLPMSRGPTMMRGIEG